MNMNSVLNYTSVIEERINHDFKNSIKSVESTGVPVDEHMKEDLYNKSFSKISKNLRDKKLSLGNNMDWALTLEEFKKEISISSPEIETKFFFEGKKLTAKMKVSYNIGEKYPILALGGPLHLYHTINEGLNQDSILNTLSKIKNECIMNLEENSKKIINPGSNRPEICENLLFMSFYIDLIDKVTYKITSI